MPNWCSNYAVFTGSEAAIKTMTDAVNSAIANENKDGCGQHIYDDVSSHRYCFYIELFESTKDSIRFGFETKWAPDLDMVSDWCGKLGLSGSVAYEECGMQVYGYAIISADGSVLNREVPQSFLDKIEYVETDDGNTFYKYNGEDYDCINDLINEKFYGENVL